MGKCQPEGLASGRREGTPPGGLLSPLMANILLDDLLDDLNPVLRGRLNYFGLRRGKGVFAGLDEWIGPRLRSVLWRQRKRPYPRARNPMRLGIDEERA